MISGKIQTSPIHGNHGWDKQLGVRLDYANDHRALEGVDEILRDLIPETVSACALGAEGSDGTCLRTEVYEKIAPDGPKGENRIEFVRKKLGCANETGVAADRCVLDTAVKRKMLTAAEAGIEEMLSFKQRGPTNADLFSDKAIHAQLYAWMYKFPDFFAYNFNMLDFASRSLDNWEVVDQPDTLATIDWRDLYEGRVPFPLYMSPTPAAHKMIASKSRGIRCSACIVNSDVYNGRGKHWMALFVDARPPRDKPWTVEFFNSAAQSPEPEWMEYLVRTKKKLIEIRGDNNVKIICVCKIWHQHSKSECGPYSMFYVWSRLNGVPAEYFLTNVVPDQLIFEYRQHLFATKDAAGVKIGAQFDFEKYAPLNGVAWDVEKMSDNNLRTNTLR